MRIIGKIVMLSTMALCALNSCAPVNFMTSAKKTPRRYSENYNYDNVKSERSDRNKTIWIVYSDRDANKATTVAGGSLTHSELKFMEPLYVIGRKGEHYKLIKYVEGAIKQGLRAGVKKKEAEYCGWIHKSQLVLFDNTLTEIRNGIKLKSLTAINDALPVVESGEYFKADSIILYSDPKLEQARGAIGLSTIVYELKRSADGTKSLVAQKTSLNVDEVEGMTFGWVDASLVVPMGQRLIVERPIELVEKQADTVVIREATSPVGFSPVLYTERLDSSITFRTLDASPVIDPSANRVYNVIGEEISYARYGEIKRELKDVNIIFAFDPTENVIKQMPMLSNAVQNISGIFESRAYGLSYSFGAVVGESVVPISTDYLSFSDNLIEVAKLTDNAAKKTGGAALSRAISMAEQTPKATNLIIYVGEKSTLSDVTVDEIKRAFIRTNSRLFGFQVYSENQDQYNNFVVQATEIIETYGDATRVSKRKLIVYSDQLREENAFIETAKNSYILDFPAQSMTQGMVVFPEKGNGTETEFLVAGVDSLVRQIEGDIHNLTSSLNRAFTQVGTHRSKLDKRFIERFGIDPNNRIGLEMGKVFKEVSPEWTTVTERVDMALDSTNMSCVGLLLTEGELEGLKKFFDDLIVEKPVQKDGHKDESKRGKAQHVKKVRKSLRGVPSDTISVIRLAADTVLRESEKNDFEHTGKIRRGMKKTYENALRNCVFNGKVKNMTLGMAQEHITTMPTITSELHGVTIKELGKKKIVTDVELDVFIKYIEEHRALIEKESRPADDLNSPNGEKYFILPSKAMP